MSRPATRGRLPPDEVHRRRVAAARERILAVLQHRVTCYRRELERLVCEVGFNFETTPRWKRPEPHHFSEAIRALVDEGLVGEHNIPIKGTSYRFWSHGKATANSSQAVLNRKVAALTVFLAVEHRPQEAGWHAEKIHHLAMTAGPWLSVGWWPGHRILGLHDQQLANDRRSDIDLAGFHASTNVPFVAQVKNGREWYYAANQDIWDLLGGAAQLNALPIFVARRFADSTFVFMKLVGGFALRATKMIYPTELRGSVPLAGQMTFTEALQELALHTDADFVDDPLPRHRQLWTAVADEVADAYERFQLVKARVLELAYDQHLAGGGPVSNEDRHGLIAEFQQEIRARDREALLLRFEEARKADAEPSGEDHHLAADHGEEDDEADLTWIDDDPDV